MTSRIVRRVEERTGLPGLAAALASLPASDLQSLLLEVFRDRATAITPAGLLERSATAVTAPSDADPRGLLAFDQTAFEAAGGFEPVELSPVCPLGTAAALGGIDQNNVLTTIRNVEVLGDSTPALALECARRRKGAAGRHTAVRLCSSHRVMRLQPFDVPGFSPHFRLFSLVSAGRDSGSHGFEVRHLGEHLTFYLKLFETLGDRGFVARRPLIEISDGSLTSKLLEAAGVDLAAVRREIRAHKPGGSEEFLRQRKQSLPEATADPAAAWNGLPEPEFTRLCIIQRKVAEPLAARFPEAEFRFNLSRLEGLGYYTGLCLRVSPEAPDGARYPAADGGFTDWTARLLSDRKERLLTSGIGSEFVCRRYRT